LGGRLPAAGVTLLGIPLNLKRVFRDE